MHMRHYAKMTGHPGGRKVPDIPQRLLLAGTSYGQLRNSALLQRFHARKSQVAKKIDNNEAV